MCELAGLGRLPAPDPRDRRFMLPRAKPDRHYRTWLVSGPRARDQGATSMCVAYAWEAWLRAHPVVNSHQRSLEVDRAGLYYEAQTVDEWAGESYDGTSVRAGAKVLQRRGYIGGYAWAYDATTIASHVLTTSPVVVGTVWTWGMFTPDRYGYIWPDGGEAGGHAWLIVGANIQRSNPDGTRGAFRMVNSWGEGWGDRGRAWITIAAMDALMRADGEACTATELAVR